LINPTKSYWLYIEPYVHIAVKNRNALLYNTLGGEILEYHQHESEIIRTLKSLQSPRNLRVIAINGERLNRAPMKRFLQELRDSFMGDALEVSSKDDKPAQLVPLLKIQKDVVKMKKSPHHSPGESLKKYLEELTLFVTSRCDLKCGTAGKPECMGSYPAYRQFISCTKINSKHTSQYAHPKELPAADIENLLIESENSSLSTINIVGGNILEYSQLEILTKILNARPLDKNYYLHYLHLRYHESKLALLTGDRNRVILSVQFPVEANRLKESLSFLAKAGIAPSVRFIVRDEAEMEQAQSLVESLTISSPSLQPLYDGRNLSFFEKYVFVDREIIREAKPTETDILVRSVLNTFNFGRLTVLSNGKIYSDVNEPALGQLGRDSIYEIIYKEIIKGKSWFRVRKHISPCKQCIYNSLCPPPSPYERAAGRNNFCHL
jgi:pseudo-rSAM protein